MLLMLFFTTLVLGAEAVKYPLYNLEHVETDFRENVVNHAYQFLSVCNISCQPPGVGYLEASYCYGNFATKKIIDGTGDAISSDAQAGFKHAAQQYAEAYNQLLEKYLVENKMTTCQLGEHWTSAWESVNDYLIKNDDELAYITAPLKQKEPFSIYLRGQLNAKKLMRETCSMFSANGVNTKALFSVSRTAKVSDKWKTSKLYNFSCLNGRYEII